MNECSISLKIELDNLETYRGLSKLLLRGAVVLTQGLQNPFCE